MTYQNPNAAYVCVSLDDAEAPVEIEERSICVGYDIKDVLRDLGDA